MATEKRGFGAITLTIIVFAVLVSIGVVVTTRFISKKVADETLCSGVEIGFGKVNASSENDVCYTGTFVTLNLKLKIQNTGSKPINGVVLNIVGEKGKDKIEIKKKIGPGSSYIKNLNYDKLRHGDIKEVHLMPIYGRSGTICYNLVINTNKAGIC